MLESLDEVESGSGVDGVVVGVVGVDGVVGSVAGVVVEGGVVEDAGGVVVPTVLLQPVKRRRDKREKTAFDFFIMCALSYMFFILGTKKSHEKGKTRTFRFIRCKSAFKPSHFIFQLALKDLKIRENSLLHLVCDILAHYSVLFPKENPHDFKHSFQFHDSLLEALTCTIFLFAYSS